MNPSLVNDLNFQINLSIEQLGSLTTPRAGLAVALGEVTVPVSAFETAAAGVLGDRTLNVNGRELKIAEALRSAETAVETWLRGKETGLDASIATATAALDAAASAGAPSEAQVAAMAAALRPLDPTQVMSLYASATDPERLLMELASTFTGRRPMTLPNGDAAWQPVLDLDSEPVQAMVAARRARAAPAGARELHDLQRVRSAYRATAGGARALLRSRFNELSEGWHQP
jgi:hypothetical protein